MKTTPLYERHLAAGAHIIDFAGWAMPSHYTSIIEEHRCTRTRAGIFDTSHMGQIEITGAHALDLLQWVMTRNLAGLQEGRMKLSVMTREDGGIIDDLTVYRLGETRYLIVTNAATKDKDLLWIVTQRRQKDFVDAGVIDLGAGRAKIDLQGPRAEEIIVQGAARNISLPGRFAAVETTLGDVPVLLSRSGYTGEDGFEIYVDGKAAVPLWDELLRVGAAYGLKPAGLGARDTLRLEAGFLLYGQDLDETLTPGEVGYGWLVDEGKDFCGKAALVAGEREETGRRLVGFIMSGKGIARAGYTVCRDDRKIGTVTSGTYAPTVENAIGYALIASSFASPGTEITVRIRDRAEKAQIVALPFYRRVRAHPTENG